MDVVSSLFASYVCYPQLELVLVLQFLLLFVPQTVFITVFIDAQFVPQTGASTCSSPSVPSPSSALFPSVERDPFSSSETVGASVVSALGIRLSSTSMIVSVGDCSSGCQAEPPLLRGNSHPPLTQVEDVVV